jgi:hypothetical protein
VQTYQLLDVQLQILPFRQQYMLVEAQVASLHAQKKIYALELVKRKKNKTTHTNNV